MRQGVENYFNSISLNSPLPTFIYLHFQNNYIFIFILLILYPLFRVFNKIIIFIFILLILYSLIKQNNLNLNEQIYLKVQKDGILNKMEKMNDLNELYLLVSVTRNAVTFTEKLQLKIITSE